jgi:large subunit ribosomal protein L25
MSEMLLSAEIRENLGTGASRALRRKGMVPATVYGTGHKAMSISVQEKEITKLYRRHGFTSTVIELTVDGKKHKVLPKAVTLHPITDIVNHADFIFLDKKSQKVDVPIVFEGKDRAIGVKRGGFFNIIFRKLTLFCDVASIPQDIVIDVSNMLIGASLRAGDLKLPAGTALTSKSDLVIASVTGRGSKTDAEATGAATGAAEGAAASKE